MKRLLLALKSFAVRRNPLRRPDIVDITNPNGDRRIGHLRAWGCDGTRYGVCCVVPHLDNRSTYSVQTEEGWFVNCDKGKIASWSKKPAMPTVADVYGRIGRARATRVPRGLR